MRLLLDTHAFIWFAEADSRLSSKAMDLLSDPINTLYLSAASAWEMAIKTSIGKLVLSSPYENYLARALAEYAIQTLNISLADCVAYERLEFPHPRHKDPFDRMIISQAIRNDLVIVSADEAFDAYPVRRMW